MLSATELLILLALTLVGHYGEAVSLTEIAPPPGQDLSQGEFSYLAQTDLRRWGPARPAARVAQVPTTSPGAETPPLAPVPAPGGDAGDSTRPTSLSAEEVQLRIQRVQADPELDEATKSQIVSLYERALQELSAAEMARAQAEQFRQRRDALGDEIRKLESELGAMEAVPPPDTRQLSLEEIEKAARQAEERLASARSARDAIEAEVTRRSTARQSAKQRADAAQKRGEAAEQALAAPPRADQAPALSEAERFLRQAEWEAARQEFEAAQQELAFYDRADELLMPLQRRVAAQRFRLAEAEFQQWQDVLAQRRQAEAVSRLEKVKQKLEELPPPLRALAEEMEKSAREVAQLTSEVNSTVAELAQARQQYEELQKQFRATRDRMDVVGMTGALGLLLRAQRAKLPDTHSLWQRIRRRQERIRSVQWTVLELSDRHAQTPPLEEQISQWRRRLDERSLRDHPEWEETLRELLEDSVALLDQQVQLYNRWLNDLVDLDNTERATVRVIGEYRRFIDEHILWIPNTPVIEFDQIPEKLRESLDVFAILLGPQALREFWQVVQNDALTHLEIWVPAALLFLAWQLSVLRLRRLYPKLSARVSLGAYYGFWPTLQSMAILVAEVAWLPALLFYLAWRLTSPLESTPLSLSLAAGLRSVAEFLLVFDTLRRVSASGGLGETHFDWPRSLAATLRKHLRWFVILGVVINYVCAAIHVTGDQRWEAGPGRLSFLIMMGLYALLGFFLFRPRSPIWDALKAHNPEGWFYRARALWRVAVLIIPLGLAVLSLLGYSYTALALAQRFRLTIILPLVAGMSEELFNRWLVIRKQRIGLSRARLKRQIESPSTTETTESGGVVPPPPETEPDLTLVGSQTRRLFKTLEVITVVVVLWWIWADILPAFGILRQVKLWGGNQEIPSVTTPAPAGRTTATTAPTSLPVGGRAITLADLLLAVVTLAIGGIIARNIAGVMEIVLPQKLPMDPGLRYALHTVASYVVVGVALVMAVGHLGLEWSQAQWLVAALGVGLGFGLQEIFANFVSGLIILFERPVRVGDLVTVGEFSGMVTRIRIRATTILNFERRELIIPNKEFITGKVINWTLSDRTNRVEVAIGVAYGSDPERVMSLILEVAKANQYVMADPAPVVLFEGFGDSALRFRLYAYLPSYDNRLAAINSLHAAVYERLRQEGIEIPFPQYEVHLHQEPPPTRQQVPAQSSPPED